MSPSTNPEAAVWLDPDTGLAPLAAWCEGHPGGRCHVWLGAGLTVPLVVDPALPLRDDAALRAYAERVLQHYGVAAGSALATWQSGRWRGAVAIDGLDWPAALALAARHRVHIVSARPGWAQALPPATADRSGARRLLVMEPAVATLLTLEDGLLCGVEVHWATPEALSALAPDARQVAVDRRALRRRGARVPDFVLPPVRRESWPGWALAATGSLVFAVAWGERPQAVVPSALPAPPAAAVADPAWGQALGHDWPGVLTAAEAASGEDLRWLALEHDARSGELRLTGIAASLPSALSAADRLGRAGGVAQALLSHSDAVADGVRFELQARLAGAGAAR